MLSVKRILSPFSILVMATVAQPLFAAGSSWSVVASITQDGNYKGATGTNPAMAIPSTDWETCDFRFVLRSIYADAIQIIVPASLVTPNCEIQATSKTEINKDVEENNFSAKSTNCDGKINLMAFRNVVYLQTPVGGSKIAEHFSLRESVMELQKRCVH